MFIFFVNLRIALLWTLLQYIYLGGKFGIILEIGNNCFE